MTFIVGFIEKENIFLFSDTAITEWKSTKVVIPSSFGEIPHKDSERTVYQSEIKLSAIEKNKLILGGAGNSQSIDSFVENIETYSSYGLSCEKIIEKALDEIEENDFEMLLGYFNDNVPFLFKKPNNSKELEQCNSDFTNIGVQGKHFSLFRNNFIELKAETSNFESWSPQKISVAVLSILQAYGTWNYTLDEGVGGAFTSFNLNSEKICWQPSLGYILFDLNMKAYQDIPTNPEMALPNNLFSNSRYIFLDQREGAFYINSPKPNFTGFLFRQLDSKKGQYIQNWFEHYEDEVISQFENLKIEYVVFICTNTKVVTIFEKEELIQKKIKIEYGEKLKIKYDIKNEDDIKTYAEFLNWITEPLDRDLTLKI